MNKEPNFVNIAMVTVRAEGKQNLSLLAMFVGQGKES